MEFIDCPHCCNTEEYDWLGEERLELECPQCSKIFSVTIQHEVVFYSSEAECLNGGEHDWKCIYGSSNEYFKKEQHCVMCGRTRTLIEEQK